MRKFRIALFTLLALLLVVTTVVCTRNSIHTYACTLDKVGTDLAVLPDDLLEDNNYVVLSLDDKTRAVIYSSSLFNYIIYKHDNPVSLSIYASNRSIRGRHTTACGHVTFNNKVIPVYDIHIVHK